MENFKIEQIAFNRGYSVTPEGILVDKNGVYIKCSKNDQGYLIFGTGSTVNKTFINVSVHRLQAYMKYGNMLYKYKCVRHLDGNKQNNSISNIAVGSYVDNYHDISKKERIRILSKMAMTKQSYSKEDIMQMFLLKKNGVYQSEIAKQFNCTNGWISMILNRKTWYTKVYNI